MLQFLCEVSFILRVYLRDDLVGHVSFITSSFVMCFWWRKKPFIFGPSAGVLLCWLLCFTHEWCSLGTTARLLPGSLSTGTCSAAHAQLHTLTTAPASLDQWASAPLFIYMGFTEQCLADRCFFLPLAAGLRWTQQDRMLHSAPPSHWMENWMERLPSCWFEKLKTSLFFHQLPMI